MKKHHKLVALVLATVMSISMLSSPAFADEVEETVFATEVAMESVEETETEETETVETELVEVDEIEEAESDDAIPEEVSEQADNLVEPIAESESIEETTTEVIVETNESGTDTETVFADTSDEEAETDEAVLIAASGLASGIASGGTSKAVVDAET